MWSAQKPVKRRIIFPVALYSDIATYDTLQVRSVSSFCLAELELQTDADTKRNLHYDATFSEIQHLVSFNSPLTKLAMGDSLPRPGFEEGGWRWDGKGTGRVMDGDVGGDAEVSGPRFLRPASTDSA